MSGRLLPVRPRLRLAILIPATWFVCVNQQRPCNNALHCLQKAEGASRPVFSEDEVAEHATKDTGVWVTYKDGVYDVTNWVRGVREVE